MIYKSGTCLRIHAFTCLSSQMLDGVNGPLLENLATRIGYHDVTCIEMLRTGARLVPLIFTCFAHVYMCHMPCEVGSLPPAGNGIPFEDPPSLSTETLSADRYARNCELLARMKEDPHSSHLFAACNDDFVLGRMTQPRPLEMSDLVTYNLSPRFAVEQGVNSARLAIAFIA